jgi:hypothetical protein
MDAKSIFADTGINFSILQLFTLRGTCAVVKLKHKKGDPALQKS